ncbi:MAG: WD40 repeat protein/serine/threonine protein kinase, partial [Chlamydiales bacterium]
MQFDSFSDPDAAVVFDFLSDYWEDVEAGGARTLREYLDRFPAAQEAVAAEYLKLQAPAAPEFADGANPEAPDADGEHVGAYRVLRELGRGGQGRVVLAEDSRIARRVALKILDGLFVSEERRERFRREAEVIARLSHPGICTIHEADIDGPVPYIAMQFVPGEVLSAALLRARERAARHAAGEDDEKSVFIELPWVPGSRTELHRVLHFFERAARALHAAHEAGVVHRDVKPANIAIGPDARPILLDFGLALDEDAHTPDLTRSGDVFGTPAYMSPEQLRGERSAVGHGTDVYSLGATLFESLTGTRPFTGKSHFELTGAILNAPLADARALNPVLGEDVKVLVETALERDQDRRYATALALAEDLRRVREFEPIRARPAGSGLRFRRWTRRQPALAAVLITSFVLLTGALVQARVLLGREQRANRFARGRHFAERSVSLLVEEPDAALLVAIEAVELAPGYLTRSALFAPLEDCHVRRVLRPGQAVRRAYDLALAPDGGAVAVGLANGEVHVWPSRAPGPPEVFALPDVEVAVRGVAFHPAGAQLAVVYQSGLLQLWSLADARPLGGAQLSPQPLLWVEFSPGGETLVVQPADGPARVLGLPGLEPVCELATGALESGCAQFSPDGGQVLTSSRAWQGLPLTASDFVSVWDARSGARLHQLGGAGGSVQWAEYSPSGARVVVAFGDGHVLLFDAHSGEQIGTGMQHAGKVLCATFAPDETRIVTTTDDGFESCAKLWDLEAGTGISLPGHEGNPVVHAAFRPDGEMLATASLDRAVRLFDARTGELERTLRARFRPLRAHWSPDGRQLFTLSNSADVHEWTAGNLAYGYRLRGHDGAVRWAAFTPDGERALSASGDGSLRLWATPAQAPAPDALDPGQELALFEDRGAPITGARFHPDGERFLAWAEDGRMLLWHLEQPQQPLSVFDHGAAVLDACFSAAGDRIASVDADGRGRVWSIDDPAPVLELDGPPYGCLRFSLDGQLLLALSSESVVRVLDARTGSDLRQLTFEPAMAGSPGTLDVAFHPQRSEIAVACADGRVRFFDPANGTEPRPARTL